MILRTIRHREGRDRLVLGFGPPIVALHLDPDRQGYVNTAEPSVPGTDLYYTAIAQNSPEEGGGNPALSPFLNASEMPRSDLSPLVVNDDHWSRGAYPVLFTAGSARPLF